MDVVRGTIESVVYFNEDNAFAILSIKDSKHGTLKAKGVLPECQAIGKEGIKGLECELAGEWKKDPKWGYEFVFNYGRVINSNGLLFFLSKVVKGVGEKLAKNLITHYGEEELTKILDTDPNVLIEFKGIKDKKLAKITASWNKYKQLRELTDFFVEYDAKVTSNLILRTYNTFKDSGRDIIKELADNPYLLTEVRGIGFKTADKIALQMGIGEDSPKRIEALIDFILLSEANDSGHTYLTFNQIVEKANEDIYTDEEENIADTIRNLVRDIIVAHPDKYYFDEYDRVALKNYEFKESFILKELKERLTIETKYQVSQNEADEYIYSQEKKLGFNFSPDQKRAIKMAATGALSIFILCGYAGTGKSTISKVLLDFYSKFISKDNIICCAFTGMASKRIHDLTGYHSSTIHSLLKFNGEKFEYTPDNPLPYDVVLIDEASMVNLDIFYYLLRAIKKDAVILLVGDDAQLPPISAGNVFNDLLQKDWIPKVKLTKIFRQSKNSVITYFAGFIREGRLPSSYKRKYNDWSFKQVEIENYFALKKQLTEKELADLREEHYQKILKELLNSIDETVKETNLKDIEKIWDIQIITAMNKTILGTKNLNIVLQEHLNYSNKPVQIRNKELRRFDKVIHLKNKNMKLIDKEIFTTQIRDLKDDYLFDDKYTTVERIYNGTLGIVYYISEENEEFFVAYPDFPKYIACYSFDEFGDLIDLGYALTIHKTQGNQFRFVFMPMINSFYIMLNSKLIYTGITRAIEKISIVGQAYAFKRSCTNIEETLRQTFLGGQNGSSY